MNKVLTYIFIAVLFLSCDYFSLRKDDREAVARVGENYLYKNDLEKIITSNISKQDSVLLATNYVNNWIKQQLLLSKATINLSDKQAEFDELVSKYRQDLFINSYKEAVVKEYLNVDITQKDIDTFYKNNNQNFRLNEELLKLKYIKVSNKIQDKNTIEKLFKSSKKEDIEALQEQSLSLESYHLNDSIWVKYSDLLYKAPILKEVDKKELLKKGNFIKKEDSLSLYLVAVKNILDRNSIAPKSYITPTIKQMILHQRKLLLLKNIEETLFEDAQKEQQFEIYKNE